MSTKPTIYLHIGAGKTGSTTIQVWLKNMESQLATAGYLIFDTKFHPGATNDQLSNQQDYFHHVLLTGKQGVEEFQTQFRKNLNYMQEHGYHSAIISAENLINYWTGSYTWFEPFLQECNWKIIAYVRNKPLYILSAWKEWGYWRHSFDEYLAIELKDNWFDALRSWDETFGQKNIYLGILEKSCMVDGLLHHDFAHAIGTPHLIANDSEFLHANPSINNRSALLFTKIRQQFMQRNPDIGLLPISGSADETPDEPEIRIQRMLKNNKKLNSMFHFKQLLVSRAPVSGTRESDSPLSVVNQAILDEIHAHFAESNRQLVARYRPDIDSDIAFPRVIYNDNDALTNEDLVMHGFHIVFESLNSINSDLTSINKELKRNEYLAQKVELLDKELVTLRNAIQKLGDVWQITVHHDKNIASLQAQIDYLYDEIIQLRESNKTILQKLSLWISRFFSKG